MRFVVDARYGGPEPSGIGNYVRGIGSRLPALSPDDRFRFWVRPRAAPIATLPNAEHVRVRAVPAGLATLLWPARLDALAPEDVFHGPANILGFGLPCPAVVTVHDVMWLEHLEWCQPRPYLRPVSRAYYTTGILRALRLADRILTVSQASADAIVRVEPGAHGRVVVTPNACEAHFRAPESRDDARREAARALGFDEPYFLVVGQNQPSKAHDVAVRAFAEAGLSRHRLVLVQRLEPGRGLHRLVRELGIERRVSFASSLPLSGLVAAYQSADALVQPSLAEGFGLPALEAMASGCPVAASDIPPLREVLGGSGLLSAPGDASALAGNLRRLAEEPTLLGELRERGLERAKAFSWDRSAALTLDVYRDVVARPRRVAA
ncbi:MAG TPA: glycosyltransferase family 1 protein [Polyangiaceae bacterium]|nr:glycosyltransferase family 1 protein [Polyangiaceae bacterium]